MWAVERDGSYQHEIQVVSVIEMDLTDRSVTCISSLASYRWKTIREKDQHPGGLVF